MKRILIVEDDGYISGALMSKLSKANFEVLTVPDGSGVVEAISQKIPDVILLDLLMPNMDGFAVLEYLKKEEKYKSIPVVVLTNLGQEEDKNKALDLGAADYVVKTNISVGEMLQKIKGYLA